MPPIRLAVAGATGRTGSAVLRLAHSDPRFQLAAALTNHDDPNLNHDAGPPVGLKPLNLILTTTTEVPCDVLIDFTLPTGTAAVATWCAQSKTPLVSGTTGLKPQHQQALAHAANVIPVLWAPNMSLGINLLLALAADATRKLGPEWNIEICETHHNNKVDAPSGTANALLQSICDARQQDPNDVAIHGRCGTPGQRPQHEIAVHALRLGGEIGVHDVHFASDTERITLQHRALSRDAFAAGALTAAAWIAKQPPGQYTMQDVIR